MIKKWKKWRRSGKEEDNAYEQRPDSMWYYFDSTSSCSDQDMENAGGLDKCSVSLGEGATLYL